MPRERIVKYPPKRGSIPRAKINRAVDAVLKARGVPLKPIRDTYKYHLKQGDTVIRSGITNDLSRREKELQRDYGKDVRIHQVGRRTTREEAQAWGLKQRRRAS